MRKGGRPLHYRGRKEGWRVSKKDWLEELRERWMRWLGSVTRRDRATWVELLGGNYIGWPRAVLGDAATLLSWRSEKETVYSEFSKAIKAADFEHFRKLDVLFMERNTKRRNRR